MSPVDPWVAVALGFVLGAMFARRFGPNTDRVMTDIPGEGEPAPVVNRDILLERLGAIIEDPAKDDKEAIRDFMDELVGFCSPHRRLDKGGDPGRIRSEPAISGGWPLPDRK